MGTEDFLEARQIVADFRENWEVYRENGMYFMVRKDIEARVRFTMLMISLNPQIGETVSRILTLGTWEDKEVINNGERMALLSYPTGMSTGDIFGVILAMAPIVQSMQEKFGKTSIIQLLVK